MFEPLSLFVGSIHVRFHVGDVILILLEQGIPVLLEQVSRRFPKKITKRIEVEDKISALPDDLLVQILLLVPTKDAVATMILSKRWRYIWTMVPKLDYLNDGIHKVGFLDFLFGDRDSYQRWFLRFIDESLRVHKAPVLEKLAIGLGPRCPVDVNVDVGKWIEKAVNRKVREIEFILRWSAEHTSLPKILYTCDTLVFLSLSEKILVDVPSLACLPSLEDLELHSVVYKDEDSLARLLSSCPNLNYLSVERRDLQDNVKLFNIKAPLLESLSYEYVRSHNEGNIGGGTLVIDCPALKEISIADYSGDSCFVENNPHLDKAFISGFCNPDDKFVACLSSVIDLELVLNFATFAWFNTVNFYQLLECKINIVDEVDWLEPLMFLLQNSPNLKVLSIYKTFIQNAEELPLSWNQPSSVPECLATHLEIFEWNEYGGRNEEKELVKYIFANSKFLKRAGFSLKSTSQNKKKMMEELESMSRISSSSQLIFSTQLEYMCVLYEKK
ncbi:PREDICTED: putative F-box/FBD/LRR-repeat protein At1g22000 [Brassica oleracea var. oleracea]|uniref:F-box domain-containing protein n=3 Tax=Brassica TaxID=3705 RepID=A0A0D3DST5_BRAOL|nr:PREDICTED: putative F-box/FBD/LRR-repeat protein At1g22000 [Brassica oleracea var. oleracea]